MRTHDLVDRDEDAETTYSRQSIRLLESPRLILSRDHLIFPAFLRTVVQKYNETLILLLRASPRLSTIQNTEWVVNDMPTCAFIGYSICTGKLERNQMFLDFELVLTRQMIHKSYNKKLK